MQNCVIFVADALRFDYMPKIFSKKNVVIKTLSQATYTPPSFTSLISSLSPENHNVRWFLDNFDTKKATIFDFFENGSYYDSPDDPMSKIVFKNLPCPVELKDISEPFVWIERLMDTHTPYGKINHGNEILNDVSNERTQMGENFLKNSIRRGTIKEDYIKGVKSLEEHLNYHIQELEKRDIIDNTLIVITSDHGELLGERIYLRKRYSHSWPICRQLVEIPTVFLNYNIDCSHMRQIDILPTCLEILKIPYNEKNFDGISVINGGNEYTMTGKVIGGFHSIKKYFIANFKYNEKTNNYEQLKHEEIFRFLIDLKLNSIALGKLIRSRVIDQAIRLRNTRK